jgi:hypothetical protein
VAVLPVLSPRARRSLQCLLEGGNETVTQNPRCLKKKTHLAINHRVLKTPALRRVLILLLLYRTRFSKNAGVSNSAIKKKRKAEDAALKIGPTSKRRARGSVLLAPQNQNKAQTGRGGGGSGGGWGGRPLERTAAPLTHTRNC